MQFQVWNLPMYSIKLAFRIHNINHWLENMCHLPSSKIVLFTLAFIYICSVVYGQIGGKENYNFREFNRKSYYFGINLGINNSNFKRSISTKTSLAMTAYASPRAKGSSGVNMHMVLNLKIGEYFDFSSYWDFFLCAKKFGVHTRSWCFISGTKIESVFLNFHFILRFHRSPKDKPEHLLLPVEV